MAQINAIRSQQYPGRAKGGMVGSGNSYLVGEKGPEVVTMGGNGYVTPNNMLGGSQEVIINFNVTAIDATSFDSMLSERRDTIVGVINQALNERGRRSLTA
jgi:SLT domain-containing protein